MKAATQVLRFEKIGKSFYGVPVLRDISFALNEGEVLGLVGENGAGKSTLMNILGGLLSADEGEMRLCGSLFVPRTPLEAQRAGIGFIHQELNLFPNLTVAENLNIANLPSRRMAGIPIVDRKTLLSRAAEAIAQVGLAVPPGTPVGDLSPGEKQLVEIAKALSLAARIVIFDEPTTSLTHRESERLFELVGRLRASGISVLYISHTLADVFRLCDRIVVLRDGEIAGEGLSAGYCPDDLIALMVGRKLEQQYPARTTADRAERLLEVRGLSSPGTLENVTFDLHAGEILGVSGLLGAGRTELARALFGLDPLASGEVLLSGTRCSLRDPRKNIRRGMAFVPEDRHEEGLLLEADVAENIGLVALPLYCRRFPGVVDSRELAAGVSRAAEATGLDVSLLQGTPARSLSGGTQQKATIAKWLVHRPAVLLLDEPTRGIDVGAKHEIYRIMDQLASQGTGIVFVSSEIEELIGVCDRILVMHAGEVTACFNRSIFDRETILRASFGATA